VLPRSERSALAFNDGALDHDERYRAFEEHVTSGGKVEATDWMPDEYRTQVLRFVEMHANSELMGVLPEREWIMRAPTLRRKLALTAKVQDEVGHAQLLYRVAEDLGKPREQMFRDLLDGRTKFHNVFHYPTKTWADIGVIAWLVDAAAIVAQQALRDSSYAPYARTMRKICWEESVHIMHGRDVVVTLATGTAAQREALQEALDRWWGPLMQMHGPRSDRSKDRDIHWRIKAKTSEELRQEFLSIYVPRVWELGLRPANGATPSPTGRSSGPLSPTTARSPRNASRSGGSTTTRRAGCATRSSDRWPAERRLGPPRASGSSPLRLPVHDGSGSPGSRRGRRGRPHARAVGGLPPGE
jgi:ring-1,2-phenylacetyl-CoA epoxidase subunit PaaA